MKRIIDVGDRIELMKLAAEFAPVNQVKPIQFYNQMLDAVSTEPEVKEDEQGK